MNKIFSIFLILTSAVFINMNFQTTSFAVLSDTVDNLRTCAEDSELAICNGSCTVNADGAIVMGTLGLPSDADSTSSLKDSCQMIPDEYRVTLYKGALCTQDPYTESGATVDYAAKCDFFFEDETGKLITLTNSGDGTASASPSLVENGLNLGIKTYTHALMIMSNHLQIKHEQDYDFSGTSTASGMRGGGDAITTGTTCWTTARTSTFSNLDGTTGANHGSVTLRVGDGTAAEASTECGAKEDAAPVFATEIIETFGAANGDWNVSAVTPRMAYEVSPIDIGGTKAAILLQSDLNTVATSMENGVAMLYAVNLTNPLVITENTSTFEIGFGLSSSVSVDFTTANGDDFIFNSKHGADPVDIRFTAN